MNLSKLDRDRRERIKAGLLEIDAGVGITSEDWWERFLDKIHSAYDVIAEVLLPPGATWKNPSVQRLLTDEIPALISDAIIQYGWLRQEIGRPEPDGEFSEPFGSYYLQPGQSQQIKDWLYAAPKRWHAKLLRRGLAPRVSDSPKPHKAKKPARRTPSSEALDTALRGIAEARPKSHEEVFRALEGRIPVAHAEPFKSARAWLAGFRKDKVRAQAWLSKAWSRLDLTPFPRGPKH